MYYFDEALSLTAEDNFLTISAYNGELAVISGARHIANVSWTKSAAGAAAYMTDLSGHDLPHGVKALQWGEPTERSR